MKFNSIGIVAGVILIGIGAYFFNRYFLSRKLYKGLNCGVDVFALRSMFPKSEHTLWSGKKVFISKNDGQSFESALREEGGTYRIGLSKDDEFDNVYTINIEVEKGKAKRVNLSFEKPEGRMQVPYPAQKGEFLPHRYPAGEPIQSALRKEYGQPAERRHAEQGNPIEEVMWSWLSLGQKIEFTFYVLPDGQKLAKDLVFDRG